MYSLPFVQFVLFVFYFYMLLSFLKDILFPIYCVGCEKEGEWCCADCLGKIEPRKTQECPVCYREGTGETCISCKDSTALDGICALFPYEETAAIGQLIKQLKYQHARDTLKIFRELIVRAFLVHRSYLPSGTARVIIPVPLHTRRQRERGFNQAELLAKLVIKVWKESEKNSDTIQLDTTSLLRARYTEQQAKLSHDERLKNLQDAFTWRGSKAPEQVVLVDDVFTTGNTLQAAAKSLKKAGVQTVWGLTLARGKMS